MTEIASEFSQLCTSLIKSRRDEAFELARDLAAAQALKDKAKAALKEQELVLAEKDAALQRQELVLGEKDAALEKQALALAETDKLLAYYKSLLSPGQSS